MASLRGKFGVTNVVGTFCFRHLVASHGDLPVNRLIQLDSAHDCDACEEERVDVWLCVDCTMRAVNGDLPHDSTPERDAEIDAGLAALGGRLAPNFDSNTGEGHREFSRCGCGACKSALAGEFHRFAILS